MSCHLQGDMVQLLGVLEKIHSHGMVHCDLKQENILVDTIIGQVKLVDFGLAVRLMRMCMEAWNWLSCVLG